MLKNYLCKQLLPCIIAICVCMTNTKAMKPGRLFELRAGKTRMIISVNGGRIVSLKYKETEFLTQSSENENFGSTLWTAPQSNWGWPPFAVLDSMEYKVEQNGNILKMTSFYDLKSGFQIEKTWQPVGENFISIHYLIRNISDRSKSVGAWEVTRVPCGGLAFFPDGEKGKVPPSKLKPDSTQKGINWLLVDKKPIPGHLKLFSTAQEGWLAYAINGMLFIKQFPDTKPEDYSPRQGEVEIYINKDKSYTELENQGAYRTLEPGEALSYQEFWRLVPVPEKWKIEVGNEKLSKLVRKVFKQEQKKL
jgi:hypothetical protein